MAKQVLRRLWHQLFGHSWRLDGNGRIKIGPGRYQASSVRRCACDAVRPLRWLTDKEIEGGNWIAEAPDG